LLPITINILNIHSANTHYQTQAIVITIASKSTVIHSYKK